MRNSIAKRLTFINTLIVTVSLLIFCFIITAIYNNYVYNNIRQQLIIENKLASKLLFDSEVKKPVIYKILTDSINIIYKKDSQMGELKLTYISDESFKPPDDIDSIIQQFIEDRNNVIGIDINSKKYLCAITTNRSSGSKADGAIISLISLEKAYNVINRFFIALILSVLCLSVFVIIISLVVSKKITNPIIKVTEITKQYAERNFDAKYIANTKDEIKSLSIAINDMAQSLQKYDKEKEKLFRNISHELKTPITSIQGYAEGLKTGIFEDREKVLDIIIEESERIKNYVNNLIYLNKLEQGIDPYCFQLLDINELIIESIEKVESIAILNDIEIQYIPKTKAKLSLDKEKIIRALLNVLSNCIKYTQSIVNIETRESDLEFYIIISDNGNGFDEYIIENLFKKNIVGKKGGSGLGLSIVKEIIEKHRGRLEINNTPVGAEYTIILPNPDKQ